MKLTTLSISLLISLFVQVFSSLNAQDLGKLRITGEATLISNEIIADQPDNRDVNGELTAGLRIKTSLDSLVFSSNYGIHKILQDSNSSLLFLSPDERVVTIYREGFQPLELILNDNDISLESGKIWEVQLEEEMEIEKERVPVRFEVNPKVTIILIDGEKHRMESSMLDIKLTPGEHQIMIQKEGYKTIEDRIIISTDVINLFAYELQKK